MKAYRRTRQLTRTRRTIYPKRLIFFDTETLIEEDGKGNIRFPLRLGVARYQSLNDSARPSESRECIFKTTETFIEFLLDHCSTHHTLYCYAHNVGFDIMVLDLAFAFNQLGYTSEPPIINNRVFIWTVKTPLGSITFLDTANYGVWTVDQLGKDMGYAKLEVDFETATEKELTVYCRRDVEILRRFVLSLIQLIHDNDLGEVKSTAASQAFNTYRHKFLQNPPTIHVNEDALKLERDGYYGGRTEAFHIGKLPDEPYFYLDVNSMYPYVMANNPMPIELRGYSENIPLAYLKARLARFYVIADVTLKTDANYYPYRGFYDKDKDYGNLPRTNPNHPKNYHNRLVFPIGVFRTTLHHNALQRAVNRQDILSVHRCTVYSSANIFADYVSYFYQLRQHYKATGEVAWSNIIKLFLNSLYGKFGQIQPIREPVEVEGFEGVFRLPSVDLDTGLTFQVVSWFGETVLEYRKGETSWSCPSIAGAVTEYARDHLLSLMLIAGMENVYYCDTDSLITNEKGYSRLSGQLHDNELGALKLEDYNRVLEIWGAKDYKFGATIRHKGIPGKAVQLSPNSWDCIQFQSFISWMNRGGEGGATAKHIVKSRKGRYTKGIVDPVTRRVTPLVLSVPKKHLLRFP